MLAHTARLLAAALLGMLFLISGCDKHADDKAALHDLFEEYQTAIVRKNGPKAVSLLSQSSLDQQSSLIQKALRLPESETHMLPISERLDVLIMRQLYLGDKAAIDRLKKLDGKTHFERVVSSGGLVDTGWGGYTLSAFRFTRTGAEAKARQGDGPEWTVHFVREGDRWMIDQTQHSRYSQMLSKYAAKSKMSEDDYVFALVGSALRLVPNPVIWKPLAPMQVEKSPLVDD